MTIQIPHPLLLDDNGGKRVLLCEGKYPYMSSQKYRSLKAVISNPGISYTGAAP